MSDELEKMTPQNLWDSAKFREDVEIPMSLNSFHETQHVVDNHEDMIHELKERVTGIMYHNDMQDKLIEELRKDIERLSNEVYNIDP